MKYGLHGLLSWCLIAATKRKKHMISCTHRRRKNREKYKLPAWEHFECTESRIWYLGKYFIHSRSNLLIPNGASVTQSWLPFLRIMVICFLLKICTWWQFHPWELGEIILIIITEYSFFLNMTHKYPWVLNLFTITLI